MKKWFALSFLACSLIGAPIYPTMDIDGDPLNPDNPAIGAHLIAYPETAWMVFWDDQFNPPSDRDFDDLLLIVNFDSNSNLSHINMGGLAAYNHLVTFSQVIPNEIVWVTLYVNAPGISHVWYSGPASTGYNADRSAHAAIYNLTNPVPEPITLGLMGLGLGLFGILKIRRS